MTPQALFLHFLSLQSISYHKRFTDARDYQGNILGDPGATSRDQAIFSGKSFLQEQLCRPNVARID